jgi:hypothetical protein
LLVNLSVIGFREFPCGVGVAAAIPVTPLLLARG